MANQDIVLSSAGATGDSYWVSKVQGYASGTHRPYGIATNSSGYTYVTSFGYDTAGNNEYFHLLKLDSVGAIVWQKRVFQTPFTGATLAATSDGGVIGLSHQGTIFKYTADGTQSWIKNFGGATGSFTLYIAGIDSSGNIYVIGTDNASTSYQVFFKLDSSGSILWQRKISDYPLNCYGGCVDSSGNLYAVGNGLFGPTWWATIVKYDTSGTVQWQKYFTFSQVNRSARSCSISPDGTTVFVVGYSQGTLADFGYAKFNTSTGNFIDGTSFYTSTLNEFGNGVVYDTSGNAFLLGEQTIASSTNRKLLLIKLNATTGWEWTKTFTSTINTFTCLATNGSIAIDSKNNLFISAMGGNSPSGYSAYTIKIPSTGNKLGTYNNVVYANYATPTLRETGSSSVNTNYGTSSTTSFTLTNGTNTTSNGDYTQNLVLIP